MQWIVDSDNDMNGETHSVIKNEESFLSCTFKKEIQLTEENSMTLSIHSVRAKLITTRRRRIVRTRNKQRLRQP